MPLSADLRVGVGGAAAVVGVTYGAATGFAPVELEAEAEAEVEVAVEVAPFWTTFRTRMVFFTNFVFLAAVPMPTEST